MNFETWTMLGLLLAPLIGAAVVLLLPKEAAKRDPALPLRTGLWTSLIAFLGGLYLFVQFQGTNAPAELKMELPWFQLGSIPIQFSIGIDGISILMIFLCTLLMPIVFLAASGHIKERQKEFVVWALVMETAMLGVFVSFDLILFYVFWELTLIPLYFIIGIWGGPRKFYAAVKFFLYTLAGSLLLLVGVILLLQTAGTSDMTKLASNTYPLDIQRYCFWLFAIGFAVKVPIVPFHTWLPDAHVEAPTSGSVILAGVLLKMGTYGFLRFNLPMFPLATQEASPFFMGIGVLGILYGAFLAWAQQDLKKLVAYSSVSHMGLIVFGLFACNLISVQGSILQMFNHGISTGALFLLVGMIYDRRHTRDIADFGGIAKVMPFFAVALGLVSFSSIGLPGLNGFIGELLILLGGFDAIPWLAGIAALGIVLGAIYMLSMLRRTLLGPLTNRANQSLKDLSMKEILLLAPLLILIVWVGVAPGLFLKKSEAAVHEIVKKFQAAETRK